MPATEHAALGASGAHRWMKCPGSIRLSEEAPDQETSKYAVEGSAAHELAELCLTKGTNPESYVGSNFTIPVDDGEYEVVEVTEGMASAVSVYTDYVRMLESDVPDAESVVEAKFSLEDLDPPAPMFGTADYVMWDRQTLILDVVDYKHGRGVVVEPEENTQLMYYALGAVLHFVVKPHTICVHVVQPRADHEDGSIRTWEFDYETLVSFKEELMAAAHRATAPDAEVGPVGDHCRFCPAQAICPAQRENALAVVQDDFALVDEETLPAPDQLTKAQILEALEVAPYIEDWLKSLRSHVKHELEEGREWPGWKLVKKRARRYWKDEDEARAWMEEHGIDPDRRKTRSPYQAEQEAKKLEDVDVPEDLWEKKSSGVKLADEDNPRPAVTPALLAADEFYTGE